MPKWSFLSTWNQDYIIGVEPKQNFSLFCLIDIEFDFEDGIVFALIIGELQIFAIWFADEEGGDLGQMAVAVVFHDDWGLVSGVVIVDDDEIGS